MEFLRVLENIRIPVLNEFMLAITTLGEETAFLVVALALFWCVNKHLGYYILSVGFTGVVTNQFLKLSFRIPRPWVLDENFTILEQAREAATGYSFPSGHTQSAVGTFGGIAYACKNKSLRIVCVAIATLVAFSRMYIGVHTPKDVLVSAVIGVVLILAFQPLVLGNTKKYMPVLFARMFLYVLAYLCYVSFYPFPENMDADNYLHGVESGYTLLGSLLGMFAVYFADNKYLKFQTDAVWWAQILKVTIGLVLVLIVKTFTKSGLNLLFGEFAGRSIRYFLVVVTAGIVWPLTFNWFSKLGRKNKAEDSI